MLSFAIGFQLPNVISDFTNVSGFERRGFLSAIVSASALSIASAASFAFIMPALLALKGLAIFLYVIMVRSKAELSLKPVSEDHVKLKGPATTVLALVWLLFVVSDSLASNSLYLQLGGEKTAFLMQLTSLIGIILMIPMGLLFDKYGRRPFIIFSYMLLGLGYALASLSPSGLALDILYPIADGFAWGALTVLFTFVVWADISPPARRAKYIAIGLGAAIVASWQGNVWRAYALPTPHITQLFSAAAVLFFLSGAMLYFVPETLPDYVRARRAMRDYIERAKELSRRRLGPR